MNIPVIFENSDLLVISKPSGIVVNRAETTAQHTIQDWVDLHIQIKDKYKNSRDTDFYERSGIVHRLDKETSGCLLIAKTPSAFDSLQKQFKERSIKKTYLALVHGKLEPQEGYIHAPIGRLPWNRKRFGVIPGGREARTKYKVIKYDTCFHNGTKIPLSLVFLYPETGRTHQLRVHLAYIGHPIIGDYLYAGRKRSRSDRSVFFRTMLHAWEIEFTDPASSKRQVVKARVPEDMHKITILEMP